MKFFRPKRRTYDVPKTHGVHTTGTLTVRCYDQTGTLKAIRGPLRNMVVQTGRNYVCNQLGSAYTSTNTKRSVRWTGIGTGNTAATMLNSQLGGQCQRVINTFTCAAATRGYYSCIATFVTLEGSSASAYYKETIYESALFWLSATQGSSMFARQTFAAVSKGSSDTLTVEWKISVG